jgi:prepilin-type N-terminal cleavage/methylation domain-containing protein
VHDARRSREAGFTLIEIIITVAVIATTVAAGVAVSLGARSFAVSTAAAEFDQLLDSARTVARETNGSTLVFAPDAYGDGTEVRVLTTGPYATLVATTLPIVHTRAAIAEAALGSAPFAFVVHTSGALGGRPGFRLGDSTASGEVGCPPAGTFHFVIRAAGASADRVIPCRISLAATGPLVLTTWPPAVIAPPPTPCGGPCGPGTLPTPPSSSPTCPPAFTAIPGGCTPPAPGGARYHVSTTVAAAAMAVGGSAAVTAQATLMNAASVAPGTPTTIPVLVQQISDTVCAATPAGPQPSGAQFVIAATAAGTCAVTIGADPSGVPGATADTSSFTINVTAAPNVTPSPPSCDLSTNGKCYHRIVDQTAQTFTKTVSANTECLNSDAGGCIYIDSVGEILLTPPYYISPPVPPTDSAHELLFRIDGIVGATFACLPFSAFQSITGGGTIDWGGTTIGGPTNPPIGFGRPDVFATLNRVSEQSVSVGGYVESNYIWPQPTTLEGLYDAVATLQIGSPFLFTYSTPSAASNTQTVWDPDFPGCDVSGESGSPGHEYGIASALIWFEIFQAQ